MIEREPCTYSTNICDAWFFCLFLFSMLYVCVCVCVFVRARAAAGPSTGGSKTSVRFTNAAFQGFREYDEEAVVAKWCNEYKRCGHLNELFRLNEKKVHAINPKFLQYIDNRYFKSKKERPSSGMVLAVLLMHVCEKVTLFGFAGSSIKDWYFPKRPGGKALPKKQWMREKRWVVDTWKFAKGNEKGGGGEGVMRTESTTGKQSDGDGGGARRRLLHAVGAERHCMRQLVAANLITMRP